MCEMVFDPSKIHSNSSQLSMLNKYDMPQTNVTAVITPTDGDENKRKCQIKEKKSKIANEMKIRRTHELFFHIRLDESSFPSTSTSTLISDREEEEYERNKNKENKKGMNKKLMTMSIIFERRNIFKNSFDVRKVMGKDIVERLHDDLSLSSKFRPRAKHPIFD